MKKATEKAFLNAYDEHGSAILRHVSFRVKTNEIAEDITQEVFFKTWRYISQDGKSVQNFKTFLYTVANNLVVDYYRQKYKEAADIDDAFLHEVLLRRRKRSSLSTL